MKLKRFAITTALAALVAGVVAASAFAHGTEHPGGPPVGVPGNIPALGLVFDGLERPSTGPCEHAYKLKHSEQCTHGPDPVPEGLAVTTSVLPVALFTPPPKVQCDGDGTSGKRVQVIYAHASDVSDRYSTYLDSIRQWAADADKIFRNSAAETYGEIHVRYVHDSNCVPIVPDVTLTPSGDDSLDNTASDLAALGYNSSSRKYMVFVDASVYCGIGNIRNDDSPGSGNLNNGGPSYARIDSGCWGGSVAAHELMHNLGGVQLSAPHSSGGWHCTDEYDRMCYSDSPYYPAMTYLCADPAHEQLFDCNHDDYFSTSPLGGSYLATHWNAANSEYLVAGPQPLWGYVWANDPVSASYTPSLWYQRNSTGAVSTIARTGTGAYTVVFSKLGNYQGTVDVTAYGSGSESCKVANWWPALADLDVNVRCFDVTGAPADTQFVASFARPISSSRFGYVWANNPTLPSYTPSTAYQFNSTGALNTITRFGAGTYRVSLPGLGGLGGTVKVTAYGSGNASCKVTSWGTFFGDEPVNVLCQTPAGAPVDSQFTMTFDADIGLLGTLTDPWPAVPERAYLWANDPSSAAYTPSLSYQYNSGGGTNTVTRSSIGVYQVTLPGIGTSRGHVEITAYGSDSSRCKVASWGASGSDELVNVRCFDPAGAPVDARYAVGFVD
jgi:hypothetical protein